MARELNRVALEMLEGLVVTDVQLSGTSIVVNLSDGSRHTLDMSVLSGTGPQGPAGQVGATGAPGPTYPMYTGSVSVDIASRSALTQFYFDFTPWFQDFQARFPNANADDFVVIPFPVPSSTIVGNPTALIDTGSNSMGDYAFVKFVTSAPEYLNGNHYQFNLSLGARGLAADGTDHSYSTGVAMSYTIQFMAGANLKSLLQMSAAGTFTASAPPV
jgi:hypothetical protein